MRLSSRSRGCGFGSLLSVVLVGASLLAAQARAATISETEPNNSCEAAQDIGEGAGALIDGEIVAGDVDFFRFSAEPGLLMQLDLRGMASGVGSIGDTVLGVFNSVCEQIGFDDDSGINTESSTAVQVPDDGIVVVAATGYPDYGFTGNLLCGGR